MGELLRATLPAPSGLSSKREGWFWHRQLKKPFFGRFMKPWRWPQSVPQANWNYARVASRSASSLSVIFQMTPREVPRGVVVCAHPMGFACKGFWLRYGHAQALLDAGFHVVAFDFNGFGESQSTNFDYPGDSMSVGAWARSQFPGLPVHALCASFGAMNTLDAIDDPAFPYDSVVAEGCAPSLPQFWKAYPLAHAVLAVAKVVAPAIERRLRPALHLARKQPRVRVLLVHSHADHWTPVAFGDELAAAAGPESGVSRLILERSEHTHGMRDEPEVYWPAVIQFLSDNPTELKP